MRLKTFTEYKWIEDGLTECTEKCGSIGTKTTQFRCVMEGTTNFVLDSFCADEVKPDAEDIPCNRVACSRHKRI